MSIRLLLTGGTIDKRYNMSNGALDFEHSHIAAALEQGRCTAAVTIEALMLKDSLEMSSADREQVLKACRNSAEQRLVITHGTDTMVDTARVLAEAGLQKTIVLTGAMVPLIMRHSDGPFNLGCAITAVQCLPAGIYIAINGEVFNWDNVVKNLPQLKFEPLQSYN
ncbi:MAG: asparaginase domain-containing protein [Thiolinea sp.]